MWTKLKKHEEHSRKFSRQGGKVNVNTLFIGIVVIVILVMGRDLLSFAKFGWLKLNKDDTKIDIRRDITVVAPEMDITSKDEKGVDEAVKASGGDPVVIISKHRIFVPNPAPGRDVEQYGYIVRKVGVPIENEDGSYNTDLLVKYDAKIIFGFRFRPMLAIGFDGRDVYPGAGSTFFQIYRFEASGHVGLKYAALGASFILRKDTSLGLGYGLFFGETTPKIVVFAKVGIW